MNSQVSSSPVHECAASEYENLAHIYDKCIGCPDVGKVCNGPNMLTLPIEGVREMVKRRKNTLLLTNEELSRISGIPLTTVNRFLSPSVATDFKYTTVSDIVRAVIGNGKEGYSFTTNPCPATSSEIRQKTEETEARLELSQAECKRLREELERASQKQEEKQTELKQEDQKKIDYLKNQVEYLQDRCEYLKETAEKRYKLIVSRDWIIITLAILCAIFLALSVAYLAWDYAHPGSGIIW